MNARHAGEQVFVYGTLMFPEVTAALLGHAPRGRPARLADHARLAVRDAVYPGIVPRFGATVRGVLFADVDAADLARLDAYESAIYERRRVEVLSDGVVQPAWAWIVTERERARLTDQPWDERVFELCHLTAYVERCRAFAKGSGKSPGA
ncbi:MAG: gamma-glutamylcyclotransferase [Planctomycetes bacterium]|nr:gamma-glutamylcyclotransferase [Planctomycetota bacterium]